MATKVAFIADGLLVNFEARARGVARDIGAWAPSRVLFAGDAAYGTVDNDGGGTTAWNAHALTYGLNAGSQSPAGFDLRSSMMIVPGNHEYFSADASAYDPATGRPAATNTYLQSLKTFGGPQQLDTTKTDGSAAYPGMTPTNAQKVAAVQWSHMQVETIEGWTFLGLDVFSNVGDVATFSPPTAFPTAGSYYNAVATIISGITNRMLVIWTHSARYTAGSSHNQAEADTLASLWSLAAPKCTLWLCGHNHNRERQSPRNSTGAVVSQTNGCVSILNGCGGGALNGFVASPSPAPAYQLATDFGYDRLTVDPDTVKVEWASLGTAGTAAVTIKDTVTLTRSPPPSGTGQPPVTSVTDWSAGPSGALTIPVNAGQWADATKYLILTVTDSLQTSTSVPVPSPGSWGTPVTVTGADEITYVWTRAVADGDGGATISWTYTGAGTLKGAVGVIHATSGLDLAITGNAYNSVDQTARSTPSQTPTDINRLGVAIFTSDATPDPRVPTVAGGEQTPWNVNAGAGGLWSKLYESTFSVTGSGGARFILPMVATTQGPSGATSASASPAGGTTGQESTNFISLWKPVPSDLSADDDIGGFTPAGMFDPELVEKAWF